MTPVSRSEVVPFINLSLELAHPIFQGIVTIQWTLHLANMLKDILSEFERLVSIETVWSYAVPQVVELLFLIVECALCHRVLPLKRLRRPIAPL